MSLDDTEFERIRKGSFSFYEVDLLQLEELARQRRRKKETDLQKEALHIGALFESIREEPDSLTGRYGHLEVKDLIKMIRPLIVIGADWLAQQGSPITPPGGGAEALTTLLGVLAMQGNAGLTAAAPAARKEAEQDGKPREGAFIRGSVLDNLALDDEEIL